MGAFDDIFGNSVSDSVVLEREPFFFVSYDCDINKLHSYKNTERFSVCGYDKALKLVAEMLIQQRDPKLVYVNGNGSRETLLEVNRYGIVIQEKKKQIETYQ